MNLQYIEYDVCFLQKEWMDGLYCECEGIYYLRHAIFAEVMLKMCVAFELNSKQICP